VRSRPFFRQESGYSRGPLTFCPRVTGSKKSVAHYGFGEIINDRCINPTTRSLLRYLKTDIYAFLGLCRLRRADVLWTSFAFSLLQAASVFLSSGRSLSVRARPTFGSGHDIRHPQGWLDCPQLRQTSPLCRQL
jgi:hypothetical protein